MYSTLETTTCPTCFAGIQPGEPCPECVDDETRLTVEQYGEAIRDQFPMATSVAFEGEVEQASDEELMTFNSYGWRVSLTNGQQFDIVITAR